MAIIGFLMLAESGHLNPSFKLAKGLKLRGHQICYFGPIRAEKYISTQGFRFISIPESFHPTAPRIGPQENSYDNAVAVSAEEYIVFFNGHLMLSGDHTIEESETLTRIIGQAAEELARKFVDSQVDLLIVDPHLAGAALIACHLRIQTVFLSTNLFFPLKFENRINHPSARFNLPVLFLCPQEFAYPPVAQDVGLCFYIEPSIDIQRKEVDFPWSIISKDKPLIYCSLGTQSHRYPGAKQFIQTVIDALRIRQDRQLVLTLGDQFSSQDFHDVPPNIVLVNQAPQLKMLRKASVMITHGGLGAVKECILFGVPMIVYPFDTDQPLNASRVTSRGLGLSGNPRTISAEQINSFIDRIDNDPSFRTRVEVLGKKFREIECSGGGAQTIEKILMG